MSFSAQELLILLLNVSALDRSLLRREPYPDPREVEYPSYPRPYSPYPRYSRYPYQTYASQYPNGYYPYDYTPTEAAPERETIWETRDLSPFGRARSRTVTHRVRTDGTEVTRYHTADRGRSLYRATPPLPYDYPPRSASRYYSRPRSLLPYAQPPSPAYDYNYGYPYDHDYYRRPYRRSSSGGDFLRRGFRSMARALTPSRYRSPSVAVRTLDYDPDRGYSSDSSYDDWEELPRGRSRSLARYRL